MPTSIEYETAKQQVNSFMVIGCMTKFEMQSASKEAAPAIEIHRDGKVWKFSDPDWNVVIMQMAKLYKILRGKHAKKNQ